jgi:putative hydrolase of HD superfamily
MRTFTENEFRSVITRDGGSVTVRSDEISAHYNEDCFNPRDGEFVEAADHLAAYIEAYMALKNGLTSPELVDAKTSIRRRYGHVVISGIKFGEIYADFE